MDIEQDLHVLILFAFSIHSNLVCKDKLVKPGKNKNI